MRMFIDGEWNGYGGELISMALCAEDGGEFYEVLVCDNPVPWVAENVMPILNQRPIPLGEFQRRLHNFLALYESVEVVADWPEDLAYFCNALITGPGERLDTPPLAMRIERIDGVSALPHNALEDARGIKMALADS